MSTTRIPENLRHTLEAIGEAALRAGREPASVRLVAVSKTVDAEMIRAAYNAGQRAFGENRVPELASKRGCLPPDCQWHMIGHLQSNKVRPAVRAAAWLHSIDSPDLLQRLDRIAAEERATPAVLLQVNVSGEASKYGISPDEAPALAEAAAACQFCSCRGLMTMAPYGLAEPELRRVFAALRQLRDRLAVTSGLDLPELSMGMSGDFVQAIAEGATMVRIGTAIFGSRPPSEIPDTPPGKKRP